MSEIPRFLAANGSLARCACVLWSRRRASLSDLSGRPPGWSADSVRNGKQLSRAQLTGLRLIDLAHLNT